MRAVDRKHLELSTAHVTDPAGDVRGFSVRWIGNRISIGRQPRLSIRELAERAEREPGLVSRFPLANDWRENVAEDRNCQDSGDGSVEEHSELHQHATSRK